MFVSCFSMRFNALLLQGEKVIAASQRADGSMRKEIRIRPGFVPVDEMRRYRIPARRSDEGPAAAAAAAPRIPGSWEAGEHLLCRCDPFGSNGDPPIQTPPQPHMRARSGQGQVPFPRHRALPTSDQHCLLSGKSDSGTAPTALLAMTPTSPPQHWGGGVFLFAQRQRRPGGRGFRGKGSGHGGGCRGIVQRWSC